MLDSFAQFEAQPPFFGMGGRRSAAYRAYREPRRMQRVAAKTQLRYRLFDLVVALAILPFTLAILAVVAIIIKRDDPSAPVLFRHTRYGLNGQAYTMYKLRTMIPGAAQMRAEMRPDLVALCKGDSPSFKIANDPRITKPGRWIRKYYLDELPQILNVLKGEMSIVGPRASSHPPEKYEPWQKQRLLARPGLTGPWQVMRDKPYDFPQRALLDVDYICHKTVLGDLKLMAQTVSVCLLAPTGE